MRTFALICLVALIVAGGMAFALGLVAVATESSDGKCVVTLTINTNMLKSASFRSVPTSTSDLDSDDSALLDVKGKITAVRPEKSELVISENIKNWTFRLAKEGKVLINDRESTLAELKAGDDATVTFDRQGQELIATMVRCTRKP